MDTSTGILRAVPEREVASGAALDDDLERLSAAIEHAAHFLPAQGPITTFIHHNTLHAFEHLPFETAVLRSRETLGGEPYLSEARQREALRRGRIRIDELRRVLEHDLGTRAYERGSCLGTRIEVRLAMLQHPPRVGPTDELRWHVAETDALRRIRPEASSATREGLVAETRHWALRDLRGGAGRDGDPSGASALLIEAAGPTAEWSGEDGLEHWSDADWERFTLRVLWRVCRDGARAAAVRAAPARTPIRHRDALLAATGVDADTLVHDILIRFCGVWLDQGLARRALPGRELGFLASFTRVYGRSRGWVDRRLRGLRRELRRLEEKRIGALESIRESLATLGVEGSERGEFLTATLLALRGWGGMIRQLETRGAETSSGVPAGSLVEFLAVRLLLDRLACADLAGRAGSLATVRSAARGVVAASVEQRAFQVFELSQVLGIAPRVLFELSAAGWASVLGEIESFPSLERRRIFHLAYEKRLYTQTLDALALHAQDVGEPPAQPAASSRRRPSFQWICCLDEREESMRRHLEELAPEAETLGVAGFFNVAMLYRGAAGGEFIAQCPVAIKPDRRVVEETTAAAVAARRSVIPASWSAWTRREAASVGLVTSVVFPRATQWAARRLARPRPPAATTRLRLERDGDDVGFTLDERVAIAERLLRDMGLVDNLARLAIFAGHGSTSLNNPHVSAYNCGACGGYSGAPNARAAALMLNDPRVREQLAARGLAIPRDTWFAAVEHETCTDAITALDADLVPESHRGEYETALALVVRAAARNARERCRRFLSAPLDLDSKAARAHVAHRALDLSQVRPELGHATNALCVVGRRACTRGLFLDRRAFLTSYDPTRDDDLAILTRTLRAVFPVCAGINLEYYFSTVDNLVYGCGTKLPHNIASLLGVMDGAAGDLRTGLPWQMVEIHEPVRLLFVIETSRESMAKILEREADIGGMCRRGWVNLATLDPATRAVHVYQGGEFRLYHASAAVLPRAETSHAWYRGRRDHLEFAAIGRV